MTNLEVKVRKYDPQNLSDRKSIRDIFCNTGFLGKAIDELFKDRDLFADLIIFPYIDLEPQHAFVAEVGGRVVGYLIGSTDPYFERKALPKRAKAFKEIWRKYCNGEYDTHPRSERYVRWFLFKSLFQRPKRPRNSAHFHYQLIKDIPRNQRMVIALQLFSKFEQVLLEHGISGCYGEFASDSKLKEMPLYKKVGFEIYTCRTYRTLWLVEKPSIVETTEFYPEIKEPMYKVCVHKKLDPSDTANKRYEHILAQ